MRLHRCQADMQRSSEPRLSTRSFPILIRPMNPEETFPLSWRSTSALLPSSVFDLSDFSPPGFNYTDIGLNSTFQVCLLMPPSNDTDCRFASRLNPTRQWGHHRHLHLGLLRRCRIISGLQIPRLPPQNTIRNIRRNRVRVSGSLLRSTNTPSSSRAAPGRAPRYLHIGRK